MQKWNYVESEDADKEEKGMGKEARALLKKINDKKNAIRSLQGEGKTQQMKDAMAELRDMQEQFDILLELDDEDGEGIKDSLGDGSAKTIAGAAGEGGKRPAKKDVMRAFVNRIVCGLKRKALPEEDRKIMDMMTEADAYEDGTSDGGFTVPQDIQTDIVELRRTENDLEQYVNVEPVKTLSGSRVIELDADSTPWPDVDEGGEFKEEETPKFRLIAYKIKKMGGILKTTQELLKDSAVNILGYLNRWIAKKSRATRNAAILKKLKEITAGKEIVVSSFDDFKDVFNEKLDPSIAQSSIVLTNQSGFNYLDKLKDKDGNYIIQPDVTDKTKKLLFGEYPIHRVSNKTLKSIEAEGSVKHPVYMGDLKEAITLFDRERISIELSTEAGDLWARDLTGIKVRDRFDVQAVDDSAVVAGEITEAVAG